MLPRNQRLLDSRDFKTVYARARSFVNPLAVIYILRRNADRSDATTLREYPRFGFVVSKKQGGAVVRNRIKRRLREAVRRRAQNMRVLPVDIVIVGRKRALAAPWIDIIRAVDDLLERSGLLQTDSSERSGSDDREGNTQ